jgi:hypothetical protein
LPHPRVSCDADTCTHWLSGDVCGARGISVFHGEDDQTTTASEPTECKTFRPRSGLTSYVASMDNVNWSGLIQGSLDADAPATPDVACIVSSCRHYRPGDLCDADEVRISGRGADTGPDTDCQTYDEKDGN